VVEKKIFEAARGRKCSALAVYIYVLMCFTEALPFCRQPLRLNFRSMHDTDLCTQTFIQSNENWQGRAHQLYLGNIKLCVIIYPINNF